MCDYDSCNKNALFIKKTLPSGDIFNVSFFKKEGYLGQLNIEFVIYQDVFYPVTETVKLYLNNDRSYTLGSHLNKEISLKEIDKIVALVAA
jgi:hypothetical protein